VLEPAACHTAGSITAMPLRLGRTVQLAENVARAVHGRMYAGTAVEALLQAAERGERPGVLDQNVVGVGDRQQVVGADPQQEVST
jgi:hypothetical protein